MKKFTLCLLAAFLFASLGFSQTVDAITDIQGPGRLHAAGNDLFICNGQFQNDNYIIHVNMSQASLVADTIAYRSQSELADMMKVGDYLYITDFEANQILKYDLSVSPATFSVAIDEGITNPNGMLLIGNALYFTQSIDKVGKLSRFDVSERNPVVEDVVLNLDFPIDVVEHKGKVYISEHNAARISQIDLAVPNPEAIPIIEGIPVVGMEIVDNKLYAAASRANKIIEVDLEAVSPVAVDFITEVDYPVDVERIGSELFIVQNESNKVVKTGISISFDLNTGKESIAIYPNPSSDFIYLKDMIESQAYSIFDITGKKITQSSSNQVYINPDNHHIIIVQIIGEAGVETHKIFH